MNWKQKILDAFIERYFASAPETEEDSRTLRLRSTQFFPDFETAHPNEKESYLEAAESLQQKGLVKLRWEKWDRGERLKTINCENFEMLFAIAGKPFPKTEAEQVRAMLDAKAASLRQTLAVAGGETASADIASNAREQILYFLEYFARHFGPREIGQGIDLQKMEEYVRFLEFSLDPSPLEHITIRALSILLYGDSKHLENLVGICQPLLIRSLKASSLLAHPQETASATDSPALPDENHRSPSPKPLKIPERSYPMATIAGKFIITFNNTETSTVNADGFIYSFSLESVEEIATIKLVSGGEPSVRICGPANA